MVGDVLIVFVLVYGLALWLGIYLIGRDPRSPRLFWTGMGLIAYALAVAGDLLFGVVSKDLSNIAEQIRWPLLMIPALFWTGTLVNLLPEEVSPGNLVRKIWPFAASLAIAGLILAGIFAGVGSQARVVQAGVGISVLLTMAVLGVLVWWTLRELGVWKVSGVLVVFTLFFALSTALVLLPHGWLPQFWTLLAIGTDVIALGLAIAYFDAFDQGEALLPDMVRSFDVALLAAFIFGGQVALAIRFATGPNPTMIALLLAVISTAIIASTLADRISLALDRIALGRLPRLRQARSELRATARALQRRDPVLDPAKLDEDKFIRLTRRALSNFGDLPRLSASPLVNLSLIEQRLATQKLPDNPLERAAELKSVLAESIDRLKPRTGADFGASDEWRYYNALYFPYVVGIKPYSSRSSNYHKDPAVREALEWFRDSVPERTLYNWQNVAAKLIAQDLLARNEATGR
ncbi:hypothetical protein BH24ACT21_BH24ACT21_09890 [soil metagenome]